MGLLQTQNLSFFYPDGTPGLRDVSLSLPTGSFTVLCGLSGSGKSTLLRLLKPELAPAGRREGQIGGLLWEDGAPDAAAIGYVGQDPEMQIVTDTVWHELAFGLENQGIPSEEIRRRVAETAAFFGLEPLYDRDTDCLSGGQKQMLNLASVLVMRPQVLLLDEPTAQLDPLAARAFLDLVEQLHRDTGMTVLLAEHRLEDVLPLADRLVVLERGSVAFCGAPGPGCAFLQDHPLAAALPAAARLWPDADEIPLTVRQGREHMAQTVCEAGAEIPVPFFSPGEAVLQVKNGWFRYDRSSPDVLRDFSLTLRQGEIVALLGGNGAGKTTVLDVLSGSRRLWQGKVKRAAPAALLPQDPRWLFSGDTVRQDWMEMPGVTDETVIAVAREEGVEDWLDKNPYDLSSGEQQRCALLKLLLGDPRILLLDEPSKGLDAAGKQTLSRRLRQLADAGCAVLLATHDVDFAAETADRCCLMFHGAVAGEAAAQPFFAENMYYTTAAARLARGYIKNAVTCPQILATKFFQKTAK